MDKYGRKDGWELMRELTDAKSERINEMRNPERIDEILKLISEIWHKNPDLRLCQLIGNCVGSTSYSGEDLYYVEDNELQIELQRVVDEIELVKKFLDSRKE